MEKPLTLGSIFITLVMALFVITTHGQRGGAKRPCHAGNYEVGGSCVPCAKPPAKPSMIYSIYCGGVCTKGHWGRFCDKGCNSGCFNHFCNRWTGHCIHGCKGNYHGRSCKIPCPKCLYCDNGEDGVGCACTKGYYGDVCQNTCPPNCYSNTCTSKGSCQWGCTRGWIGEKCDIKCTNCRYDFGTDYNCMKGWYGSSCNDSCIGRCPRDLCFKNGSCIDGCGDGFWGELCDMPCPKTCHLNECNPSTGWCMEGCLTGWYGDTCDKRCPTHCTGECKIDGSCQSCSPGYTGSHCNMSCPSNCHTCHQETQKYGYPCYQHCEKCLSGVCDLLTGSCSDGCLGGWYGEFCNMSCPHNCRNITPFSCSQVTGECMHGCIEGWYGGSCDRKCSSGCREGRCETDTGRCLGGCTESLSGAYCNNTCTSHCINARCDVVMDTTSVVCIEGCEEGWHGPYCQEPIEDSSRMTIIVLTVFLCILVVCLILVLLRKRISRFQSYNKQSQWYLFPVNNSAIYSTQTSVTYSTQTRTTSDRTWSRDQSTGTTCMTRNNDGCIDGDSLYGYEVVGGTDDDAVHQPINDQYSQDETYLAIPDSHFA